MGIPRGSTFDNAANTIVRLVRFGDGGNHTLALSVVENRERLRMRHMNVEGRETMKRERIIGNARDARDVRTDFDPFIAQQLNRNATRDAQRSGKAT